MRPNEILCTHSCRNTCAMLSEAMDFEDQLARFYEQLTTSCDYPDVHVFLIDCAKKRRALIGELRGKLAEMEARGRILDGVMASFDPEDIQGNQW